MAFISVLASDLAAVVEGTLEGEDLTVSGVAGLREARAGDLSFLANKRYEGDLVTTEASLVIIGRQAPEPACSFIRVENPDLAFSRAVNHMAGAVPELPAGIHPSAQIAEGVVLGEGVRVGPNVVVEEGCKIGENTCLWAGVYVGHSTTIGDSCCLMPNVVVYHESTIGSRVILHAGAVVGSDGFGYAWDGRQHVKIPQVGVVVIEDDVEIGANTCLDRARFGVTRIGQGAKLDNLIQIAHNVDVGPLCAFAAMVGVAGSTTIGTGTLIGGKVGIYGHVDIGAGVQLSANAGVTKNLPAGGHYTGYPAKPHKQQIDDWRNVKAIGSLRKKVKDLEQRIQSLET
ncbi:MAG: UDP-3-O-(3-hydroxymyristoyl)glucosamine N-acyltransferase [Planctomycetota bacterium]|jgi:UDP-3-O-[3-hydroxymyristoyl] glucosamine N-acyltransferase